MQHIFYFEWLSLRRNSLLIGIIGLLVALSLYAITYGTGVTHSRREIIDVLRAEEAGRRSEWVNRFAADTSTAEGRNAYQAVRDPFSTEDIFRYTIYAPGPLAALSIGQADVYPYFRRVSARSLYYDGYGIRFDETYGELTNPEKLLAGNLDLSFVFVYLLPLLIIALGYNLLSAEQEQGTYPLLATLPRSLRTILAGKLLFRYLIIAVLIVLLSLLGFGITGVLGQAAFAEAGLWLLVALSYAAFWFALVWLVVSLRYGSASNALLLLGAWLLFLVLIPGLLNNYLNDTHPVSARAELMSSVREEMEDLWDRVTADTSFNR
jgi:ABC-2 type transport system permease protein